jgi:hypothetical protein
MGFTAFSRVTLGLLGLIMEIIIIKTSYLSGIWAFLETIVGIYTLGMGWGVSHEVM